MHFDIRSLETTLSTNDDVKRAAEEGAAEGLVVWALEQTAGRGRQGRQWQSPRGNLYASVLLRPACDASDYGLFSFIAALAIFDAVRFFLPDADIQLKWPNDVLVAGKKISGILLEAGQGGLILGMGINVGFCPDNPLYPVTSLKSELGNTPPLDDVLAKILAGLDQWYGRFSTQGFNPVRTAWLAHARRGAMRVRLADRELSGIFKDLDQKGLLCLTLPDGSDCFISAGDVFF